MSEKLKGCFSHITDDWKTPIFIYTKYIENGFIDPCPFQADFDGLLIDYYNEKLFINPPYSDLNNWIDYSIKQYKHGCEVVLLIPARTDTKAFHKLLSYNPFIYFIKGRLHFNDSKCGAPFPSLLITLRDNKASYSFGDIYELF